MGDRRVVITGIGAFVPTGNTPEEAWQNIAAGKSGIGLITQFDRSIVENQIAGEVKNFDPDEILGRKESRRTDRSAQLAVAASRQAFADSGLEITADNSYDIGCIIGSGVGGIGSLIESVQAFLERGHRAISPLAIPRILIDSSSGKVSMDLGLRGPNFNITTACATGNNCIGEAAEIIKRRQADVMLAGATEAAIVPITIAGFNNMKALSHRNDDPEGASRPFDADRDGFVPAEGAATLVLEDLEHALARGAKIYGEVLGYGHTSDAYHPTAPMETGEGAAKAMVRALEDAGLTAKDIDYINAHGTGTQLNDMAETKALKVALGEEAYNIPISSTKSMTGHLLGAAGTIEAIIGLMAIRDNFIPPTINLETPDPECDLNYTPNVGVKADVDVVMSNGFGFGGHNATIILGRYTANGTSN
ncbi:beta-ketoacyl-ACP synthase II [Phototrophicus methaneseepsis]|uniref:beta-ketoacyl-ACP synthase II n=1 Tax=Phototrophicus methaneseepsis TaxID=2710758 RepID=UPI001E3738A0|nr:beta-ketoacyl-ACP synthase II [Phototrophicus methaneseepsis]